jgi:hypothetical protein
MKKEWRHRVLVFGFILVLCLPLKKMVMDNKNEVLTSENRKSASFPKFSIRGQSNPYQYIITYTDSINNYYSDHMGFRSELLSIYRFCKLSLFNVSPYNEKVVKGKDHWYFLGYSLGDEIKESKGVTYFSEAQLELIENNLKTIDEDCKEKGIKLYMAVAPNKLSVYGQYLPIIQSEHPTKLEQLMTRMKKDHINIIDLKRDFAHYADKRLFYLNDTHWNFFGAFLGYRTLIDFILQDFPDLKVLSIDDFKLDTTTREYGDLTRMLSMNIPEECVIMKPKFESNTRRELNKLPVPYDCIFPDKYEIRFIKSGCPHKVLIFRDSFFTDIIPFVKESFGASVFIWYAYDKHLIDIEKPDIIIYEVVERDIDKIINL